MSQITPFTFGGGRRRGSAWSKPERYTLDGLLLTGTASRPTVAADNGVQTGELGMGEFWWDGTLAVIDHPSSRQLHPCRWFVNYKKGQEYHATLTMPEGAPLLAGGNYTYTVKVRNKVLEVSEATICKVERYRR